MNFVMILKNWVIERNSGKDLTSLIIDNYNANVKISKLP